MTEAKEQGPGTPRILLIGGPQPTVAHDAHVTRIGCDLISVLSQPCEEFYAYDAVVFWPDRTYLEIPSSPDLWTAARRTSPRMPELPEELWPFIACLNSRNPMLGPVPPWGDDQRPPRNIDTDTIMFSLKLQCAEQLRHILRGTAKGRIAISVIPPELGSKAISWLSNALDVVPCNDRADSVRCKSCSPLRGHISEAAALIHTVINAPWPWNIRLSWPDFVPVSRSARWRDYWSDCGEPGCVLDDSDGTDLWAQNTYLAVANLSVESDYPHINGAGDPKSLLLWNPAEDGTAQGFIWIIPPPDDWATMQHCVEQVLLLRSAAAATESATAQPTPPPFSATGSPGSADTEPTASETAISTTLPAPASQAPTDKTETEPLAIESKRCRDLEVPRNYGDRFRPNSKIYDGEKLLSRIQTARSQTEVREALGYGNEDTFVQAIKRAIKKWQDRSEMTAFLQQVLDAFRTLPRNYLPSAPECSRLPTAGPHQRTPSQSR